MYDYIKSMISQIIRPLEFQNWAKMCENTENYAFKVAFIGLIFEGQGRNSDVMKTSPIYSCTPDLKVLSKILGTSNVIHMAKRPPGLMFQGQL